MGSPWEHTLFSVTYRQRCANCACYIGVLPALLSVGFSGGRNVRKIQNYLSGEATRTFRYPRRQMFLTSKLSTASPVYPNTIFTGATGTGALGACPGWLADASSRGKLSESHQVGAHLVSG